MGDASDEVGAHLCELSLPPDHKDRSEEGGDRGEECDGKDRQPGARNSADDQGGDGISSDRRVDRHAVQHHGIACRDMHRHPIVGVESSWRSEELQAAAAHLHEDLVVAKMTPPSIPGNAERRKNVRPASSPIASSLMVNAKTFPEPISPVPKISRWSPSLSVNRCVGNSPDAV